VPSYVEPKQAPRLRLGKPLWLADVETRTRRSLTRDTKADVVIVGGGITGVLTAWTLSKAGIDVVVLEAERVAQGSTAASTALLMQEPDTDFRHLASRYGTARARRIWELSHGATADLVAAIRALRVACDLEVRDSIYYAAADADLPALHSEFHARRANGIRCRWLGRSAVRDAAGLDAPGAIRTSGNAQVDPLRAGLGFATAAERAGARIFERSMVRRIEAGRGGVRVATARAAVTARRIVVATGYATPYFEPLAARFRLLQTYVVASEPLSARRRRHLGPGPIMLWDTERPYHYARWSRDGRLMLGGGDRPRQRGRGRRRAVRDGLADVRRFFVERYPALADVRFDFGWEGLFATTPDGLPYIGTHRHYPSHLFALGYGGNGMTFGYLAAELLAASLNGQRSADLELFAFGR
jgi:glycine/D-amino acid oxidase-like deaminating enzyme